MKASALFFCLYLFAFAPLSSRGQGPSQREAIEGKIPPIIFDGLHQLGDQKPEEAEKAWFRDALPDGQQDPQDLPNYLAAGNYGAYQNFNLVSAQDITPRLRILYLALNFERQPILVKFTLYQTTNGWILFNHKIGVDERLFESIASSIQ